MVAFRAFLYTHAELRIPAFDYNRDPSGPVPDEARESAVYQLVSLNKLDFDREIARSFPDKNSKRGAIAFVVP